MRVAIKKANIIAIILWILGIILAFVLSATSPYMWLSDTCLLLGFYPLLISARRWWPWLIFGVGNLIIGSVIFVAQFIPPAEYAKIETKPDIAQYHIHLNEMNSHLQLYHPSYIWVLFGISSLIIGMIMASYKIIRWTIYLSRKKQQKKG